MIRLEDESFGECPGCGERRLCLVGEVPSQVVEKKTRIDIGSIDEDTTVYAPDKIMVDWLWLECNGCEAMEKKVIA